MGNKINKQKKTKLKMAATLNWVEYIKPAQKMIEDLKLEEVWQYFDEDLVCYGPLETDVFRGKENFHRLWTENNEVQKAIVWQEPYMEGEIGVRRGNIGDWYFECRVKTHKNNGKAYECVTKTVENFNAIRDFVR